MCNKTLEYYNQNAVSFVQGTRNVNFTDTQEKFLRVLRGKKVLDFGCGSGRDTKYFMEAGLEVTAIDGSEELCKIASVYTGIPVRQMLFQEFDELDEYDGIWACTSILHLPKREIKSLLLKMIRALRKNGVIYTSFKYGDFEGERNGRIFTDFTEGSFNDFMKDLEEIAIEEQWITGDVRPGREEEKWLNLLLRKTSFKNSTRIFI